MPIPHRKTFSEGYASEPFLRDLEPLSSPLQGWKDLDPLMERIGDSRFVLLGEASHGTAEYYDWRRIISQRLIREKNFTFIAVEGDWPDCYRLNRFVKGFPDAGENARDVLSHFQRWPTWMWANKEVVQLAEWLRDHNHGLSAKRQVGFYGLDVYSLWESMDAVARYVARKLDGEVARATRRALECFEPYGYDAEAYARSTTWSPKDCEEDVVQLLRTLRALAPRYEHDGSESFFDAEQNALILKNAENYYRVMIGGDSSSWNIRDHHMAETLNRLIAQHGPDAKAILWEHNTHVGDARFTDMASSKMVNVGQLVREEHAEQGVVLVGFSSYRGTVIAGQYWGAPMQRMTVPAARDGSWEHILHLAGATDKLIFFDRAKASQLHLEPRGHRAIGVVYRPQHEAFGNYVPSILPRRYDVMAFLDETQAVHPLQFSGTFEREVPETFPSGF